MGDATCLSRGHLAGGANDRPRCTGCLLDTAACGVPITTMALVQQALSQAASRNGHDVVALQPGTFPWTTRVEVNDQDGVTLRPLSGVTTLQVSGTNVAIGLQTGPSVVEGLVMLDAEEGVHIGAPDCVVRDMRFINTSRSAGDSIHVNGPRAQVVRNFFSAANALADADALDVTDARGSLLAQNVISGAYRNGIYVADGTQGSDVLAIAHNSIAFTSVSGHQGIHLQQGKACLANNTVERAGSGTAGFGIRVDSPPSTVPCWANVTVATNHMPASGACTGQCTGLCPGPLCSVSADATTPPDQCPTVGLVDQGTAIGLDQVDGDSALLFTGTAPDVGAREAGTTRVFGGTPSVCP